MPEPLVQAHHSNDILESKLLIADKRSFSTVSSILDTIDPHRIGSALEPKISQWLTSVLIAWSKRAPVDADVSQVEAVMERVSSLLSAFTTEVAGTGQANDTWIRTMQFGNGVSVDMREMDCSHEDVGTNVWMAGCLFSYFISKGKIPVSTNPILELGCGTGVVGITASKFGATQVLMTDYLPGILDNAVWNVQQNACEDSVRVFALDWTWIAENAPIGVQDHSNAVRVLPHVRYPAAKFDVIYGADICYDKMHARLVPPVCARFLSHEPGARIYLVSALRISRFEAYNREFEEQMRVFGFKAVVCEDIGMEGLLEGVTREGREGAKERKMVEDIFRTVLKRFRFYVFERV
ncbi:hypothetical protein HDU98_006945 [Podochytrium sp. JEL0797]|nr:hypothetical protein HDU98_006940 [Podochytrium sp. JEL0797]KAJ3070014.1 hypothetical protein HDU98_006945 [Podochytrium sp. JEL0797]